MYLRIYMFSGFMVTMGISILLFTMSRYKLGWHWSSILKHFFIRGFVLIVVNWVMYPSKCLSYISAMATN